MCLLGFCTTSSPLFFMITFLTFSNSLVQLSITSYENSMLLWHIFREPSTLWAISKQNLSMRGSNSLMMEKILLKQRTEESLLKGSGWLELDQMRRRRDLILDGLSRMSLSVICLRDHLANSATALLHISLSVWLFLHAAPSIKASNNDSTSGCSYTRLLLNHLTIQNISGSNSCLDISSISVASFIITGNSLAQILANGAKSSSLFCRPPFG